MRVAAVQETGAEQEPDSTEQRVVTEALSLIDRNRPVSAILNRIEPSLVSRYYNHYYYGYGKGPAS